MTSRFESQTFKVTFTITDIEASLINCKQYKMFFFLRIIIFFIIVNHEH